MVVPLTPMRSIHIFAAALHVAPQLSRLCTLVYQTLFFFFLFIFLTHIYHQFPFIFIYTASKTTI